MWIETSFVSMCIKTLIIFIATYSAVINPYASYRALAGLRAKRALDSVLLEIPGIARTKSRALLRHFGSLAAIGKATVSELSQVNGVSLLLAQRIYRHLNPNQANTTRTTGASEAG